MAPISSRRIHQTFRLLNVVLGRKTIRNAEVSALGFPQLEELCMATSSSCPTSDRDLLDLLLASPKLRVLDLRGCFYISAPGLAALPCEGRPETALKVPDHTTRCE